MKNLREIAAINYSENMCCVGVSEYEYEIPETKKEENANMAKSHGWKCSWKMFQ